MLRSTHINKNRPSPSPGTTHQPRYSLRVSTNTTATAMRNGDYFITPRCFPCEAPQYIAGISCFDYGDAVPTPMTIRSRLVKSSGSIVHHPLSRAWIAFLYPLCERGCLTVGKQPYTVVQDCQRQTSRIRNHLDALRTPMYKGIEEFIIRSPTTW